MSESFPAGISERTESHCALQHRLSRDASASDGALPAWQKSNNRLLDPLRVRLSADHIESPLA